ncbi:hypothetical protein NECAME_06580 [Necator americanus]|uniref:Uncharacterized protein n=1 Tax=Necator americanus TaxID=51031 RepID=W2TTY9_NECAM|nr:hypothetical protein NECAME_06580 [Necator americanus]ETN85114.1 hypothetical protein NECAME_06580 [Necator americanus]
MKSYLVSLSLAPNPTAILVDRSPPLSSGFSGAPTREGSVPLRSFEKERHSVPTSTSLNNEEHISKAFLDLKLELQLRSAQFPIAKV